MDALIANILSLYDIDGDKMTNSGQTAAEVLEGYIEQALDIIEETLVDD